jgi:hypothetical protein
VKFDVLPTNQNVIKNISRVKLHVLEPREEEVALKHKNQVTESESSSIVMMILQWLTFFHH